MNDTQGGNRIRARELGRFLEIQNLGLNLSFALAFLLVASNGLPFWRTFLLVVIAFVGARNAGHAFNRWADRDLDARNPRTQGRALVTGRMTPRFALGFALANGGLVVLAAGLLNPLALVLAPVAVGLVFGYSYTKRFTSFTTPFLGLVEAVTPAAAFIAVQGALPEVAMVASAGMLFWGTAFETVHSLGDVEADRAAGTFSLPVRLGYRKASALVPVFHAAALLLFAGFGWGARLHLTFYLALAAMAVLVAWIDLRLLHRATPTRAAFRAHFILGALFLLGVILSLFAPTLG